MDGVRALCYLDYLAAMDVGCGASGEEERRDDVVANAVATRYDGVGPIYNVAARRLLAMTTVSREKDNPACKGMYSCD
jgi:hypothetical protein